MADTDTSADPMTTTSSAGSRVAGIYELLEQILDHLEPRQLLLIKRTSTQFNVVINSSPLLPPKFHKRLDPTARISSRQQHPLFPKVFRIADARKTLPTLQTKNVIWSLTFKIDEQHLTANKSAEPESWRKLLIYQEATRMVDGTIQYVDSLGEFTTRQEVFESLGGVTLGQLADWAMSLRSQHVSDARGRGSIIEFTATVGDDGAVRCRGGVACFVAKNIRGDASICSFGGRYEV